MFIGVLSISEDGGYTYNSRKHNTNITDIDTFKAGCEEYEYLEIIRNPDNYIGKDIVTHVNVCQRITSTDNMWTCQDVNSLCDMILDNEGKFVGLKHEPYKYAVIYELDTGIVTGDNIIIYGTINGVETFERGSGGYLDMPVIDVIAVDFVNPVE